MRLWNLAVLFVAAMASDNDPPGTSPGKEDTDTPIPPQTISELNTHSKEFPIENRNGDHPLTVGNPLPIVLDESSAPALNALVVEEPLLPRLAALSKEHLELQLLFIAESYLEIARQRILVALTLKFVAARVAEMKTSVLNDVEALRKQQGEKRREMVSQLGDFSEKVGSVPGAL